MTSVKERLLQDFWLNAPGLFVVFDYLTLLVLLVLVLGAQLPYRLPKPL